MLKAIWVLARARFQVQRNTFWRGRLISKLGTVIFLAALVFVALILYGFARFAVRALRSPELLSALREAAAATPGLPADPAPLLAAFPSALLLGALTLLVFSSFGSLLSTLFLSGDIDMLLVAPVPMRAVFVVKFFGGLITQYGFMLVLFGPLLVGYGQGMGYGPLYFLVAVVTLALLPLLPAGVAALLVLAVVRVLPAHRAREIVSVLGGMLGLSFWLLAQLNTDVTSQLAEPESLGALLAVDQPLLPSAWAGRALVAAGEGQPLPLLFYGGLFLASSVGVFASCLLVAERLYYAGWSNLAGEGGRARKGRRAARAADAPGRAPLSGLALIGSLLPQQSRAIAAKDLRLFTRDLRNLQAVIFPLALSAIWTFQLFTQSPPAQLQDAPEWAGQLQDLSTVGVAFFICVSLSGALAGAGVSREGKGYWLLKLAPISAWRLLLGKAALAFLPYPVIGTFFLVALALFRGVAPLSFLQQWLLLILGGLGCTAVSIALGAIFPRLSWDSPSQQTTWQNGCLSSLFYPVFLLLLVGMIGAGAVAASAVGGTAGVAIGLLGWAGGVGLTAAVVGASLFFGVAGLERIEV